MSAGMPPDDDKRVPPFVSKLYDLVQRFPTVCSFGPDGESILMHNPKYLERDILPRYFRHGNYRSFVRQLNLYDFRKDHNRKQVIYRHKNFRRDRPDILHLIERQPSQKVESEAEKGVQADMVIPETVPRHLHGMLSVFRPGAKVEMWAENSWWPGEVLKWTPEGLMIRSGIQESNNRYVAWSAVDTELRLSSALGSSSSTLIGCPPSLPPAPASNQMALAATSSSSLSSLSSSLSSPLSSLLAPPFEPGVTERAMPGQPPAPAGDRAPKEPPCEPALACAVSNDSVQSHPRFLAMVAERDAYADLCRKANVRCVRLEDKCRALENQLKEQAKEHTKPSRATAQGKGPVQPPWGAGAVSEGALPREEEAPLQSRPQALNPPFGNDFKKEECPQLWHFQPSRAPPSQQPSAPAPVPSPRASSSAMEYADLVFGLEDSMALDDSSFAALVASVSGEAGETSAPKRPKIDCDAKAKLEVHPFKERFFY